VKQKKLFEQFPPVTKEEWIDRISADLKGADFNKRVVWKTAEGFDVMPFYRREDLEKLNIVGTIIPLSFMGDVTTAGRNGGIRNSWLIRQNIRVSDYPEANKKALSILMKGIDSVGFIIDDPATVNEENLTTLLKGIHPEGAEINFTSDGKAREIISLLTGITARNGFDRSALYGAVEADPLSRLMLNGTLCIPVEAGFDYLASLTADTAVLPHYRNIQVNGSNFSNAGAGPVKELAFSISMAVEYLSQLTGRGISADVAASKMRFSFGTGSNYFMEIAKLRAARILWSLVAGAYNPVAVDSFRMEIHSVTSGWNKTLYDPYVNMLRTQTEAMSAVLGGTDSLTVNPYDIASDQPGEFAERIARNQQLILKEEAYFDRVADPSAGSWYIENLTSLVAENAWKLFIETEESGGFMESIKSGIIQEKLADSAQQRKNDIRHRKEILLGTNQYPNPEERHSLDFLQAIKPGSPENQGDLFVRPVRLSRGSEELEKIRVAVDKASSRPVVFLLTVGNHTMRRARAQFSSAFLGCAGYKIIDNEGYDDLNRGIEEALASNAKIIVVCSSDEEYSVYAPEIFNKAGDNAIVVVAGIPPDAEELRIKGLRNFISVKSDMVETLKYYNSLLEIKD
jgi:methylmalonyl-CoA mutase